MHELKLILFVNEIWSAFHKPCTRIIILDKFMTNSCFHFYQCETMMSLWQREWIKVFSFSRLFTYFIYVIVMYIFWCRWCVKSSNKTKSENTKWQKRNFDQSKFKTRTFLNLNNWDKSFLILFNAFESYCLIS